MSRAGGKSGAENNVHAAKIGKLNARCEETYNPVRYIKRVTTSVIYDQISMSSILSKFYTKMILTLLKRNKLSSKITLLELNHEPIGHHAHYHAHLHHAPQVSVR